MQNQGNCYKNVWILSGTSDGPVIANRLLELNYSVFASVLTYKAGLAYIENPKLHIITGKLKNKDEIINFIKKNKIICVVDATHPFAVIISENLKNANIAILEPSKNNKSILEKKLCDFWEIDYVLCRESGSYSQKNWESIVSGSKMKLFLVKRPKVKNDYSYSFDQYHNLINHIIKKY